MAAIGTIVPSANRVVERVTAAVLTALPGVTAHHTRVDVAPGREYDLDAMRRAAELLAHAQVDAICWNGTHGAGLGFDPDVLLCAAIHTPTGAPAVTSALATLELLRRRGARRIALVTPFL